jgi:hypothetical protein
MAAHLTRVGICTYSIYTEEKDGVTRTNCQARIWPKLRFGKKSNKKEIMLMLKRHSAGGERYPVLP